MGIIANEYVAYYVALTHELLVTLGIKSERLRFRQHLPDERAHYATDCWDAEVFSPRFGWVETVGIADRTDYDLRAHAAQSGTPMTDFIQYDEPKKTPRRRIIPNMSVLGKQYRTKAKAIFAALETALPTPEGADIEIGDEKIHIPADLFEIRDEVIDTRGEDIVPHVIEPSYGIDRMCPAQMIIKCHGEEWHAHQADPICMESFCRQMCFKPGKKIAPREMRVHQKHCIA